MGTANRANGGRAVVFSEQTDVMDYRMDVTTGEMVYAPGWWRKLQGKEKSAISD